MDAGIREAEPDGAATIRNLLRLYRLADASGAVMPRRLSSATAGRAP